MGVFVSQFRQLAHGALNWDTQLDADLSAIEKFYADGTGTINWASGVTSGTDQNNNAYTVLTMMGWHALLTLNAFSTSGMSPGNNDTILAVGGTWLPQVTTPFVGYSLSESGAFTSIAGDLSRVDGGLRIRNGNLPARSRLFAAIPWKTV